MDRPLTMAEVQTILDNGRRFSAVCDEDGEIVNMIAAIRQGTSIMRAANTAATALKIIEKRRSFPPREKHLEALRRAAAALVRRSIRLANFFGFDLWEALCEVVEVREGISLPEVHVEPGIKPGRKAPPPDESADGGRGDWVEGDELPF